MINVTTKVKENEWKDFLEKSESATIYHTPEWKNILKASFGYKAYYLFAKEGDGNIVGLFPLFNIKSWITKNRMCSVPFSHLCGPIGDETAVNLLISEGVNLYGDLNVNHLEIRDYIDFDGFQRQNAFSTYILELSPNIEEVWKKFRRDVRRGIEKSKKGGISVDATKNIEDLKEFYELNCMTKKEIGVPCHTWKFFKNLFTFLNDKVYLYIARCNGEIIAGGVMEYFKDGVLYGYGAANPGYLKLHPYDAFIWKSIEEAYLNGYKYYDFGRTSYDNVGLINFKTRWGTIEKKLYYSYYPNNPGSLTGNRKNFKYKLGTKVIRGTPMPIYKKFSDAVFGSFG